jgi:hypothetical protein
MAHDSTAYSHQEWIGYVQPVGVVVSTPALLEAGAAINRNFVPLHRAFLAVLPQDADGNPISELRNFSAFATDVLGWQPEDLAPPPDRFTIPLPGFDDLLQPTWVVNDGDTPILLILETHADFDQDPTAEPRHWNAAPQLRFERLLRECAVPAGLLISPQAIRLVYAPKGESSGHITFKIGDIAQVAGRPMLAALHMLLSSERLFSLATGQRLPALLAASRRYQNSVSTKLSRQVMEALFDLLRGFQAAHDQNGILEDVLRTDPNQVYAGLLTVLLRLVFVLYAEDRGLLSSEPIFVNNYSVAGLFASLREDDAHHPDTMDSRYGAWARLLALFRLIWRGAKHGGMRIPGRRGYLFDPNRYPFLEGRAHTGDAIRIPRVSDGVIHRVLQRLLVLEGERLSYRNLDVEQIGSVYEAMMGFELHVAGGPSIAIKPKKRNGAPVTINLSELLGVPSAKRNEWLNKTTDHKVTGQAERALKEAVTIEALMAALDRRIARNVTPDPVPTGAMIFQPSPERRRSGSHYTPRSLTQPIVEAALAPVLKKLGDRPRPEQILALKVCDPAMGSGAFLVEACRQLGDALVAAWHVHNEAPPLPPDEDELLHVRRIVAQRCLYGVDKNEMATDLAKLSLWLATLARDHEFTFLNHALGHGDSLAGLSARQIAAFHWEPKPMQTFLEKDLRERITRASAYRKRILDARDDTPYAHLTQELEMADQAISLARMAGDAIMAAFFSGEKWAARENAREQYESELKEYLRPSGDVEAAVRLGGVARALRKQEKPVVPFHWEIEFPEVFDLDEHLRPRAGFDVIVGNPPFAGRNTLVQANCNGYLDWLKIIHKETHGNSDLAAHFFRRAFSLLEPTGSFGLIATNTIGQGDTRSTGLRWITSHGGTIFRAIKRLKWPGEAAVTVSVVHVSKGQISVPFLLGSHRVEKITAYLFHAGGNDDPARLQENVRKSFNGTKVLGMGFTFDDTDSGGIANPISQMERLIAKDSKNAMRIFPFIGGEEINDSPTQAHHRYVINFGDMSEEAARQWPDLLEIVERKVKPDRLNQGSIVNPSRWWMFARPATELYSAIRGFDRVLAHSQVSSHFALAFLPADWIYAHYVIVFAFRSFAGFCAMQCRVHEVWARFMASSLEDRLRYTPTDCFETFPFPRNFEDNEAFEQAGNEYYDYRAALMIGNNEGLTKTYNRFHRPDEYSADILKLRELHDAMDRSVLDAYGWHDLQPKCDFFAEFDDEEEDDAEANRPRQKKYRYRWPEEIHDEVLARLLALNRERAGLPDAPVAPSPSARRKSAPRKKAALRDQSEMF